MNPNQYALIKSWAIRSEILRMVSSERYEVTFMRQDGVRQPWGFYQPTNWKHPHLRLPHQGNHSRRRMQPSRSERHPHRMWKCKWIFPYLKNTPYSPRMGKICASSRIGFRLKKSSCPCDGPRTVRILYTYWSNFANLNDNAFRSFSSSVTITGWP